MKQTPFVFMGGTFDPIHHGHLRTALELRQWINISQLHLMPTKIPAHREIPECKPEQRLEMLELAVENEAGLVIDARELYADTTSYSLFTLQALRAELGEDCPLCMVVGMDSYQTLEQWYNWQQFPELCHLIVVARPGYIPPKQQLLAGFTQVDQAKSITKLLEQPAGKIIFHKLTRLDIAATQIRQMIKNGESARYLLPERVWQYIQDNQLYGINKKRPKYAAKRNY